MSTVDAADEVPVKIPYRGAVLVGSTKYPKWLAFDCPCEKDHRILISLDKNHHPHWRMLATKKLTLSPSVDAVANRTRCHYSIRDGRIIWACDTQTNG